MMKKILFLLLTVSFLLPAQTKMTYEIIDLGPNVNTKLPELNPYITPDGKKLFFIRENDPSNTKHASADDSQDIWYCNLQEDGSWSQAKHLGFPFNTMRYNTIVAQSSDGNIRYIKGYLEEGEYIKLGFSVSTLQKDGWSDPKGINVPQYDDMVKGRTVTNNFSASNNILLMSFGETSGYSPHDIYVSFLKNGRWTKPKKLGKKICSEYDDNSPFLAADGVTLYFSSNRPGGYGNNDIYVTKRLDDTWENWSDPVNLGEPINGEGWDAYFTIPASGDYFYMVKDENIVKLKAKEEQKPNPVVLVRGRVLNSKNNKPIEASINYVDLETSTELGIAKSNIQNGEFTIILPYGKNYSFQAKSEGYYSVTENLNLKDVASYKEVNKDLYLTPIEKGQTIRINNIFFETAKADLKQESFFELDNLVQLLKDNSKMEIFIAGHTDNVGGDEYNMKLSKDRAAAVVSYLVSKGIDAKRLSSDGFGKTKPVADNATDEGKAQNRRVEFTILKK